MGVMKQEDLTSQVDGVNTTFVLAEEYEANTPQLFLGGQCLRKDSDYVEQPTTHSFLFNFVPTAGDALVCYYLTKFSVLQGSSGFDVLTMRQAYLFGLNLKDRAGNPITDQVLQQKLSLAISYFQREFDIFITPTVIKSNAILGTTLELPEPLPYDIIEPPYDYDVHDYMNWGYMRLRKIPVISIERVRLIYPTGQTIITYPNEWLKLYPKFGQLQIVPMAGSFKQYPLIGQGAMYLPLLSGFLTKNIPSLIHIDYTCGFKQGEIPLDFADIIYKKASIEILRIAGQAQMPGVASVSTGADGLSESTTLTQSAQTTLFQSYINEYKKDIEDFVNDFRETQKGINFVVS